MRVQLNVPASPGSALAVKPARSIKSVTGYLDDVMWRCLWVSHRSNRRAMSPWLLSTEPKGDVYGGGAAAAPVFSRITQEVLRIRNAVPDAAEEADELMLASAGGASRG